jgi:hypothetical protein
MFVQCSDSRILGDFRIMLVFISIHLWIWNMTIVWSYDNTFRALEISELRFLTLIDRITCDFNSSIMTGGLITEFNLDQQCNSLNSLYSLALLIEYLKFWKKLERKKGSISIAVNDATSLWVICDCMWVICQDKINVKINFLHRHAYAGRGWIQLHSAWKMYI